jgi:hypothetical protein
MSDAGLLPIWRKPVSQTITALSTKTVASFLLTEFRSMKITISVWNDAQNKSKLFESNIINENGVITENVFAKIGSIGISFNTIVQTGPDRMDIQVENKENYILNLEYAYMITGKP